MSDFDKTKNAVLRLFESLENQLESKTLERVLLFSNLTEFDYKMLKDDLEQAEALNEDSFDDYVHRDEIEGIQNETIDSTKRDIENRLIELQEEINEESALDKRLTQFIKEEL